MISGIQHVSNLFHTRPQLTLAQMLVESTQSFDRVYFCNSGTEANEAALKFAKKYALVKAMCDKGGAEAASAPWPPAFSKFACKDSEDAACATRGGLCDCWPQATQLPGLRTGIVAFKVRERVCRGWGGGGALGPLLLPH